MASAGMPLDFTQLDCTANQSAVALKVSPGPAVTSYHAYAPAAVIERP